MLKKLLLLATVTLFVLVGSFKVSAQNAGDVMIQGFDFFSWQNTTGWYNVLKTKTTDMQNCQINAIWLPPPSNSGSNEGYLPRELYTLDSKYGSATDLRLLITDLKLKGIKPIADIVINHRVGNATAKFDFVNPVWNCSYIASNDESVGCGAGDTGEFYGPARDIDHTSSTARQSIKDWMNYLKTNVGFEGWRYDFVKGFGASYISEYNAATSPYVSVGEYFDQDVNKVSAWLNTAGGTAFDFPLKFALNRTFGNNNYNELNWSGKTAGLLGVNSSKSITFVDNHDTGRCCHEGSATIPGGNVNVMQGYAYILTHPGVPMIWYPHFYDASMHDAIKTLISIRKSNNITNVSSVVMNTVRTDLYSAIIDGKVAMKIGPGAWDPGTGWTLKASGTNYAVWSKSVVTSPGFTVYFNKPTNWSTGATKVYYWNTLPAGAIAATTWPGVNMTSDGGTWYKFIFTNVASTNLIFNDNGSATNKTVDLTRNKVGYYSNGVWSDTDPRVPTNLKIHLKTTWATPKMYYWNPTPAGAPAVTWPGVIMTSEGNGWFVATIPGANCSNIIFSNNGATQTIDLNRCGEGFYNNGAWSSIRTRIETTEADEAQEPIAELSFGHYPNPSNDKATITFNLKENSFVTLKLVNDMGSDVATLVNENLEAGNHKVDVNTATLKSGLYIYRIAVGGKTEAKKLVIAH
jgi:alpha-amylase